VLKVLVMHGVGEGGNGPNFQIRNPKSDHSLKYLGQCFDRFKTLAIKSCRSWPLRS